MKYEAMVPAFFVDASGEKLDRPMKRCTPGFAPDHMSPVNSGVRHDPNICQEATYEDPDNGAFWSSIIHGNESFMKNDNNINGNCKLGSVKPVE